MIDGDPGAGKTTFIKRLCYIWAQSVLNPGERDTEDEYLYKYTLVIPIILRFVKEESSLLDILSSQLHCLRFCEICALVKHQEINPDRVLLLLDGFDEYTGRSAVENVINKEEIPVVLCITTSRPHAIERLRRHTSQAVDQHVRLCGFNEQHIKQYVKVFCEYHNLSSNTGEELIKTLFEERQDILEVAKIPIRAEMICIVWAAYGKLGETLANLYDMFIIHLITHWETKQKTRRGLKFKKMSPEQVMELSEPVLIKIGQLADTWEKHNRLRIVFRTDELEEILGEDFDKVINIGILTKSHPSNILQESKWSFSHLTIQEYFVAYMLGNDTNGNRTTNFITKCKNNTVLQRCELIFCFLCSKNPSAANEILTEILLQKHNEQNCQKLFDFICKLYPYYAKNTLNVPLPSSLKLEDTFIEFHKSELQTEKETLNLLLHSDRRLKQPNLKNLTMEAPIRYENFMDVPHIEGFSIRIVNEEEKKLVSKKIHRLLKLTSFSIYSSVSLNSTDHTDILKNVSCDSLTDLSVAAPDAMDAVANSIHRFKALQHLHVDDTVRSSNNTYGYNILSVFKKNSNIKQVSLLMSDLDDRIIQETLNMKVKLQVKEKSLSEGGLRKVVSGLDFTGDMAAVSGLYTGGLYNLDLSGNDLKDEGESLGQLMAKVTSLRVLCLHHCNIKADTVKGMVQIIKKINVKSGLHTLIFGRYKDKNNSNLETVGCCLGELVALTPNLFTLELGTCGVTDTDLINIFYSLPATTSIHTLNMYCNNLGDSSEGLASLLSHTPHLQALAVGGLMRAGGLHKKAICLPAPVTALCEAAVAGSLTSLHVLDMSFSQLQPGSLGKLGQHLQYINTQQVIGLKEIKGAQSEDYHHLYRNLIPSLQHLCLYTFQRTLDVNLMLDYQYQLGHLDTIHVNLSESDTDLLQEVLEQHNPHIQVYSSFKEDTWRMYVKEKDMICASSIEADVHLNSV